MNPDVGFPTPESTTGVYCIALAAVWEAKPIEVTASICLCLFRPPKVWGTWDSRFLPVLRWGQTALFTLQNPHRFPPQSHPVASLCAGIQGKAEDHRETRSPDIRSLKFKLLYSSALLQLSWIYSLIVALLKSLEVNKTVVQRIKWGQIESITTLIKC